MVPSKTKKLKASEVRKCTLLIQALEENKVFLVQNLRLTYLKAQITSL